MGYRVKRLWREGHAGLAQVVCVPVPAWRARRADPADHYRRAWRYNTRSGAQGSPQAGRTGCAREDPREDKPKLVSTFTAVMEQFLEHHARPNCSPAHAAETERILKREALPRWRTTPIDKITRGQVIDVLDSIKDRGAPIMANRTKAALSKLFRFAVERGYIDTSPALMVSAPSRERQRERVLAGDDLARVWLAGDSLTPMLAAWFRFHVATGQRLNETAGLRWDELDIDARLWVLPAERSKNAKTHSVPLSELALAQIAALPRFGEWVFTTTGTGPIVPGSKIKAVLVDASGVDGWTFHDLRRSCATWLEGGRLHRKGNRTPAQSPARQRYQHLCAARPHG